MNEELKIFSEECAGDKDTKSTWYKNGALPPEDTFVRCVLKWCGVKYYVTGYYNSRTGWNFMDNANRNAELIAWAHMPEYEE